MAISYTLKVTQLDCTAPDDTVVVVHWAYTGTDGEASAGFGGTTSIERDQEAPFTPFDQLTEEQVAEWVLATWTPEQTQARQDEISRQLMGSTPALPWIVQTVEEEVV